VRWIELFAGIGGARAALPDGHAVVQAIDHDEACHAVYTAAWGPDAQRYNLDSLRAERLAEAEAWWLSPPCQPYTVRGRRRGLDDPRARSLLNCLELLAACRPRVVAMENVPGFQRSGAHRRVREVLDELGYHVHEALLCPSELGVPMRRPRWYLVADQRRWTPPPAPTRPAPLLWRLRDILDADPAAFLWDEAVARRYRGRLAVADPADPEAVVHVFTGAYGTSAVYCGSWLATPDGPRRFSPTEILRLMGLPPRIDLGGLSRKKAYKVVGNSLSVHAVRAVLAGWDEAVRAA